MAMTISNYFNSLTTEIPKVFIVKFTLLLVTKMSKKKYPNSSKNQ